MNLPSSGTPGLKHSPDEDSEMGRTKERKTQPWDGYEESDEEREFVDVLRKMTNAIQAGLKKKQIRSALIGGTALRLADGLPRASKDLDLKVTRATSGTDEIAIDAVNKTANWSARQATEEDEERGHEGIMIVNKRSGTERSISIDLIPGSLGGIDRQGVVEEWIDRRGGITTYPTHVLTELKLQTLIGNRTRRLAKDVVDVAWLINKHGYLVRDASRAMLHRWVQTVTNDKQWEMEFERTARSAWGWTETINTMKHGLDEAEKILKDAKAIDAYAAEVHRRTGDAVIAATVDETGEMEVRITGGDGKTTVYGKVQRYEAIGIAFATRRGFQRRQIPELLRSMEHEHQRQQALARARNLDSN